MYTGPRTPCGAASTIKLRRRLVLVAHREVQELVAAIVTRSARLKPTVGWVVEKGDFTTDYPDLETEVIVYSLATAPANHPTLHGTIADHLSTHDFAVDLRRIDEVSLFTSMSAPSPRARHRQGSSDVCAQTAVDPRRRNREV